MKQQRINKIVPCIVFSGLAGILSGGLIFLFKLAGNKIMHISEKVYAAVRADITLLPWLVGFMAVLGLLAALILKLAKECRGGGIPTAVATIRGLLPIRWVRSIFGLFVSSMLTFFCGVPLGNEGPSVQMGTAVGKGTSRLAAKEDRAWDRYIMTGGASAGFAVATGAPLTGIFFAFEEAHRRFSPILFMIPAVSVLTGVATQTVLSDLFSVDMTFFDVTIDTPLPIKYQWIPIVVGAVCGFAAILFTKFYRSFRRASLKKAMRIPFILKVVLIFAVTAILGFVCEDFIGTGHSLMEKILHRESVWYILLIALCVRALLLICANNEGVTGGLFVPTLTFGAIIGSLIALGLIAVGVIPEDYYAITVVVGMASFLSASSRTPITAITFAVEALCGVANLLPVGVGVTIAYIVIEVSGITAFNDTVMEAKVEAAHEGKTAVIVDTYFTVQPGAFVIGKEVRDILWPPTCVILSVDKQHAQHTADTVGICCGDILQVHYQTYDPDDTLKTFEALLGKQQTKMYVDIQKADENYSLPE